MTKRYYIGITVFTHDEGVSEGIKYEHLQDRGEEYASMTDLFDTAVELQEVLKKRAKKEGN